MPLASPKLLLIEDNPADATLIQELIEEGNISVIITTADRLEVAERIISENEAFDVVLLDLGLPDSSGYETFEKFKERHPDNSLIVLSGLDDKELSLRAVRHGAQDYLLKNEITSQLLVRSIEYALERWEFRRKATRDFERLKRIIEKSLDAILIVNQDDDIVLANPAATNLFGIGAELLHTKKASALISHRNHPNLEIHHPELGLRIVDTRSVDLDWEGEQADYITLRDITERIQAQEDLRTNEERFRNTIDIADDAIISVDSHHKIILFNNGAERIFGYREEEILGESLGKLLPDQSVSSHTKHMQRFASSTSVAQRMSDRSEVMGKRKDGSIFPAEASISKQVLNDQMIFTTILRDVSDRKLTEVRLRESRDQVIQSRHVLLALNEAGHDVLSQISPEDIYKTVGNAIKRLGYETSIYSVSEDGHHLVLSHLSFQSSIVKLVEKITGMNLTDFTMPYGIAGPFERVLESGNPEYFPDFYPVLSHILPNSLSQVVPTLLDFLNIKQGIMAPMHIDGGAQPAVLLVTGNSLTEQDVPAVNIFAQQISTAMENALLVEKLQLSYAELSAAYNSTLIGWSKTLELRDDETQGHTLRVTDLTVELAERLGVTGEALVNIQRGALLHDIGKIGIPDEILLKPGPLSDDEWVIMKRHTEYARDLLTPIDFLNPAIDIPYCHHEKWDGSGYPQGLSGEDIPFAARMFAVVDVYDALTSDRPYRLAWTKEKALTHILEQKGIHFDPEIAEAFVAMKREMLAVA